MSLKPEFHYLASFIAVGETGSIAEAADRLAVGQPAVRAHLRRLEKRLGAPLLRREEQAFRLTAEGATFIEHARRILALSRGLEREMQQFKLRPQGCLRIGMPPIISKILGPKLVERVAESFPDVRLKFFDGYSWDVCDWLESTGIDIGIYYGKPSDENEFAFAIAREDLYLVSAGPPPVGQHGYPLSAAEIFTCPLLLPSRPHRHRLRLEELALKHDAELDVRVEVNSLHGLLALIGAGLGHGILPLAALPSGWQQKGFRLARIQEEFSRHLIMATSSRRPETPLMRALQRLICDLFNQELGQFAADHPAAGPAFRAKRPATSHRAAGTPPVPVSVPTGRQGYGS